MTIRTADDYLALITSQHADKPIYTATVEAAVDPAAKLQAVEAFAVPLLSVDFAVGVQLDWIGEWVGITRRVPTPIIGVYFSWDNIVATGWNSGIWKGPFDPDTGLTELPDDDYRILIRAKIQANIRGRSVEDIYAILDAAFPGTTIGVTDNNDMTIDVTYTIADFTPVQEAILTHGLIPIKPCGVGITYIGV